MCTGRSIKGCNMGAFDSSIPRTCSLRNTWFGWPDSMPEHVMPTPEYGAALIGLVIGSMWIKRIFLSRTLIFTDFCLAACMAWLFCRRTPTSRNIKAIRYGWKYVYVYIIASHWTFLTQLYYFLGRSSLRPWHITPLFLCPHVVLLSRRQFRTS